MAVKVILQQDIPNIGKAGEVKQVAPGYFRNYLMPRGLAIEASRGHMSTLTGKQKIEARRQAQALEQADSLARRIQDLTITIPVKLGEQGRMYGSVTNKDLSEQLQSQADITIDRHRISLKEPLKSVGVHSVPVKLDQGIEAHLRVELVPEAGPANT